jgi:MraZ protein
VGKILSGRNGAVLEIFVSRYVLPLDAKRRVSLPAKFRDVVERLSGQRSMVLAAEHNDFPALKFYQPLHAQKIYQSLVNAHGDDFSAEAETAALSKLSTLQEVSVDGGGRIILNDDMIKYMGAKDDVLCLGAGAHFLMLSPDAALKYIDADNKMKNDALREFVASQRSGRKGSAA